MSRTAIAVVVVALAQAGACTDVYDYEPTTAGEGEGNQRELRAKSSTQFVRSIYADLLGRTPASFELVVSAGGAEAFRLTLDEEAQLANALDGLGDSLPLRNVIVKGLLHSTEVSLPDKASAGEPRAFIRAQFRRLLGRDPNPYELSTFADEWETDPAVGPRAVIRAIVGSREYQSQ